MINYTPIYDSFSNLKPFFNGFLLLLKVYKI